ncbi:hypothetical protein TraAM80_09148 [Trypanosoma rangeli]|uniref:Uncharacterized protein n=1 Tax=Trypanosoma rangeli TaxID=5698 RepID=A0A422MX39_TRYRA|nr:uncharacterized protein TraAM80_09148 [Trypanosoma rangeli]RNE97788.1 hypothetical protein TraAM80_09148 [Trypanosoma rangeli]|eukprot:RNE97788.1 hypothetical protein TraAM80_09148 [Trypanosoma rangeli]
MRTIHAKTRSTIPAGASRSFSTCGDTTLRAAAIMAVHAAFFMRYGTMLLLPHISHRNSPPTFDSLTGTPPLCGGKCYVWWEVFFGVGGVNERAIVPRIIGCEPSRQHGDGGSCNAAAVVGQYGG